MFDIILDRDGPVNVDVGYTHKVSDFRFSEGTVAALQQLRDAGARFSIATGQSGIARGMYGEQEMAAFNDYLIAMLKRQGISIVALAFCPHHPKVADCECRKPKTGMLDQIEAKIGSIDWSQAWGIGDKPSDSHMILAKGGRAVLLRDSRGIHDVKEEYWTDAMPEIEELKKNPRHFIADDMAHAAQIILENIKI